MSDSHNYLCEYRAYSHLGSNQDVSHFANFLNNISWAICSS
jgi:hypothetical protein